VKFDGPERPIRVPALRATLALPPQGAYPRAPSDHFKLQRDAYNGGPKGVIARYHSADIKPKVR